jgi:putative acetyltransferase
LTNLRAQTAPGSAHALDLARLKSSENIIDAARNQGIRKLSLETGSWAYFQPAVVLYRRYGFIECPPFGACKLDPNSIFTTRDL